MFCVLFLAVLSKAKRTETRAGESMQRRNSIKPDVYFSIADITKKLILSKEKIIYEKYY